MKKILLTLTSPLIISTALMAQTYCGSSRYDTEMFSTVTTTSNVTYGQNLNLNSTMTILKMDIYEPTGDVAPMRPVIVFAHGGSFIGGSKTDSYAIDFCTRFAKRGYVVASIDYRLGMGFPINQASAQKAVWRATQDMKAAVRFFRQDAATTNTYKVDPNYVFAGGYSAGAFMGVHYAYLDQSSEVPSAIDTTTLGGLEGSSGNPGYSTAINGVLNLAGAVGDTLWIKPGDEPMVTAQGNVDGTVPYCYAMIYVSGFPIMYVSGGGNMHIRCFNIGLENPIHTYYGLDHDADILAANMDSTCNLVSDFLYKKLGCTPSGNPDIYINNQTCVPGVTGIENVVLGAENVSLYPNPASESFQLTIADARGKTFSADITDITGRKIQQINFSGHNITIERGNIPAGIYFLKLISNENEFFATKVIFTEK
ncbi:MAG: carboxylesterase family protein [Bacteroidetes bacterium]|nr:carboxylesterase family protein [Bacteroidota bacterium]